jgi:tRNA (mo5U34)-methyltransferase
MSKHTKTLARADYLPEMEDKWGKYVPQDMTGETVLDIGGWAGAACIMAQRRGAKRTLLVDSCRSPHMLPGVEFYQMDVTSDLFYNLPEFDHVFLFGVIYHLANPMGILQRCRKICRKQLWIESAMRDDGSDEPLMGILPKDWSTNWWQPNVPMLRWMLGRAGFDSEHLETVPATTAPRALIKATPTDIPLTLPRIPNRMRH